MNMMRMISLLVATAFVAASLSDARPAKHETGSRAKVRDLKTVSLHGVRLGMGLSEARQTLLRKGFRRFAAAPARDKVPVPVVWEAEYRLPNENTVLSLGYSDIPKRGRTVTKLFLWQQVPRGPENTWRAELAKRFGHPASEVQFQGHPMFIWGVRPPAQERIMRSRQCLFGCVSAREAANCKNYPVLNQPVMTGEFNSNDPGKLYFVIDLDDLNLIRTSLIAKGRFPRPPDICPMPVI